MLMADIFDVCVTFDLDLTDGNDPLAEVQWASTAIRSLLDNYDNIRVTWFVRLDAHLEKILGRADAVFYHCRPQLSSLTAKGDEIGWHPHCYVQKNGEWRQNVNAAEVARELHTYGPLARDYKLNIVRMGWGFQTNETISVLAKLGFRVDSSAIPRPCYELDRQQGRNWTVSPTTPYWPSRADYRIPGEPSLPILEVPISTSVIQAPYDAHKMIRYFNLAFHPHILEGSLEEWIERYSFLVSITHPYELAPRPTSHGLIAFDTSALMKNIESIQNITKRMGKKLRYLTISEFANLAYGIR